MAIFITLLVIISLTLRSKAAEIIRNPGFELVLTSADWVCNGGCTGTRVTGAIEGTYAYKASVRTQTYQGPIQSLTLGASGIGVGKCYLASGYAKILGTTTTPQTVSMFLAYALADGSTKYEAVFYIPSLLPASGWKNMSTELKITDYGQPITKLSLYMQGPGSGIDFMVDKLSLADLVVDPSYQPNPSEILINPGFEIPCIGGWFCGSCEGSRVGGAFQGTYAYKSASRTQTWQGPNQELSLLSLVVGKYYLVTGYVKILGTTTLSQRVSATLSFALSDGTTQYLGVASIPSMLPSNGWKMFSGEFRVPDYGKTITRTVFYLEGPSVGVDFLVDSLSITEIVMDPSWKTTATTRINQIRKGDLTVTVSSTSALPTTSIQIRQLTHEFGFGSAVAPSLLQSNALYTNWYMNNFDWAVIENDFKWRHTEATKGLFTWSLADAGMLILEQNGKKVRGHTIHWADKAMNPDWVQAITNASEMYSVCMKRVTDLLTRYKGRLQHWDVNNEMLGWDPLKLILTRSFQANVYGSNQINFDLFKKAKTVDPLPLLFLNDYSTVETGERVQDYYEQYLQFKAAGAPVQGLGVQGHFFPGNRPSGPLLLSRLDRLSAAGAPIWVTELDYSNTDPQQRADGLEDVLTAFFSHPNVNGILFWGFWDQAHWEGANASLVDGPSLTPNAAGLMWQRLFKSDWRSNPIAAVPALSAGASFSTTQKVFYGTYEVKIVAGNGSILKTVNTSLSKSQGSATLNIQL